jgi:hypothetical protein
MKNTIAKESIEILCIGAIGVISSIGSGFTFRTYPSHDCLEILLDELKLDFYQSAVQISMESMAMVFFI